MTNKAHDLSQEFPEYKDLIHNLKISNAHFAKLFEQYHEVNKELLRIEQEIETPSDEYIESDKKKRLNIKDELLEIIRKEAA